MFCKRPLYSAVRRRATFILLAALTFAAGSVAATFWLVRQSSHKEKPIAHSANSDNALSICDLLDDPDRYSSSAVRVRATLVGYHQLALYDSNCLGENRILRATLDQPLRQKLITGIDALNGQGFVQGNFRANVTLVGRLEQASGRRCESEGNNLESDSSRSIEHCFVIIVTDVESVETASPTTLRMN
jgi:hypothetical protein